MNKKTILFIVSLVVLFGLSIWFFLSKSFDNEIRNQRDGVSSASGNKKDINMQGHWKDEDLRENFVLETIKEFEVRNPDLNLNLKWNKDFEGGRKGALNAIVDQIKNGEIKWDIIWLEPFYYQEIASALGDKDWGKKYLVDFEKVTGFADSQKSFILSNPQYRNHMNGILTGPYIEGFYQPFFYNKKLTDMMGISIKEKGMTYNDLLGYFKAVDDYNKKNGTNIPILYESGDYKGGIGYASSTWNIFQSLFRSEFSDLKELENLNYSEEKMVALKKTLYSIEELSKYKPLIKGWKNLNWFETRDYVLNDKAVFTVCGASWMFSHWHGIDADKTKKMVPVEMPVYREVNHYMGGYNPMFAVMKDSPVVKEATDLLMSFSTANSAEKWIRYAKAPSGVKGNISKSGSDSKNADQFDRFITYITNKYGGNIFDSKTVDYILGSKYKDLTLDFTMHLGAVMDGDITAEQAYNLIVSDMKKSENN